MQASYSSPSSFVPLVHHTPHVSTVAGRGCVGPLTGCVTATSSRYPSPSWLGLAKGVVGLGVDYAVTKANGGNAARSAMLRSRMAAGAGSKLATDLAGVLEVIRSPGKDGPFVLIGENGDSRRLAWDPVQLRARWGQWR